MVASVSSFRSRNMAAICSSNTKPELVVRRTLSKLGFRYKLQAKDLPGKPDLVFRNRRKVIFVHGCFWHQHRATGCTRVHTPATNTSYWRTKLMKNVKRDEEHERALRQLGWEVMVVWECELADMVQTEQRLALFLGPPRLQNSR